ncbi:hypothetical protein GOP47_0005875 [Adiantum capillus-veneris]|uniref:Uncharacterized protein n=1 Tax=Adiantum capillus-veneris TaxID=13818 RepID=A0A9D4ZJV4_ADICA|nr:hypothetical protein GOP47_0005875 [Adiantum capillus-veneris]
MAGDEGAALVVEKCPLSAIKEGPVVNMMSKRLRALKKKFNKILQIEESKLQGKVINKEQEEVLKMKSSVAALIEEYERLREPLQAAVKEELAEREKELMVATLLRRDDGGEEERRTSEDKETEVNLQKAVDEVRKETEMQDSVVCGSDTVLLNGENINGGALEPEHARDTSRVLHQQYASSTVVDGSIADLLTFLYFAQLFDVRSHGEVSSSVLWTKAHERSSCLSYDCVTEDETSPLLETDLDDLSYFGSLLSSRPPNATLSHRDALQRCVEHAKLWLQNSEAPIREDLGLTYSRLRERLNRILSSEYFTMIPELQTVTQQTAVAAASASAQYASHIIVHKAGDLAGSDETSVFFAPQEQQPPYQPEEQYSTQPFPSSPSLDAPEVLSGTSPSSEVACEDKEKVETDPSVDEGKQAKPTESQPDQVGSKSVEVSQHEFSRGQEGPTILEQEAGAEGMLMAEVPVMVVVVVVTAMDGVDSIMIRVATIPGATMGGGVVAAGGVGAQLTMVTLMDRLQEAQATFQPKFYQLFESWSRIMKAINDHHVPLRF